MKKVHITVMTLALALACAKGEQSKAAATDSTARNLTLAPSETSAARHDVPVPEPTLRGGIKAMVGSVLELLK